jgi:hypothetical protein
MTMEIRRDRYLERLIAHKGNGRFDIGSLDTYYEAQRLYGGEHESHE